MTWTGWDGSVWPITDSGSGVFVTDGGIKGLHMPPFDRWTSTSPMLAGSRYLGSKATERECFWPLFLYSDVSSDEWLERDAAFWASLRPDEVGVWSVTAGKVTRTLKCRFVESDDAFTRDPVSRGWNLYGITLVAEQPFWTGALEVRSFTNEQPVAFFGAEHSPVPETALLFISSGSTLASAEIDNPGDEEGWPVFVLDGPWDSGASVGVGSGVTAYNAAVAAGSSVVIDNRPGLRRVEEIATPTAKPGTVEWWDAVNVSGTDRISNVDPSQFALGVSVPRKATSPLAIEATGAGAVHVALEPLYHRAFGRG
jgi:hypothetical protein